MTQRSIHKVKPNGLTAKFEDWLLTPEKGRRPKDGSERQQKVIWRNLERAALDRQFPIRVKLAVIGQLHSPCDAEKSLRALIAIGNMARISEEARDAFLKAARKWHADETLRASHPERWEIGEAFIRETKRSLLSGNSLRMQHALIMEDHRWPYGLPGDEYPEESPSDPSAMP